MMNLEQAEKVTNTSPTEGQKRAGNYKKGKVSIRGMVIAIENPAGSIREGVSPDGKKWKIRQKNSYGYFKRSIGRDKDHVDVYLGPKVLSGKIFIIDQIKPNNGQFDEHKVMFGFSTAQKAKSAYHNNYEKGWRGFGAMTEVSEKFLKEWLRDKSATQKPIRKIRYGISMIKENVSKVASIKLHGTVSEGVTLKDLQNQCPNSYDTLIVDIASPGGSVLEGLMIMKWFDELSSMGKVVITVVTGNAYSIASLISIAANYRVINKHGEIMVHNPMLPEIQYANADVLEKHVVELRILESNLRSLYVAFSDLEDNDIEDLMSKETFINPRDAVKYGFSDEIVDLGKRKFFDVEDQGVINLNNTKSMSKSLNLLNKVLSQVTGAEFVNQTYSTKEGGNIEIYQTDLAGYSIDDRTNLKEGEVTLSDGHLLVIEDYLIKDKISPESEETGEIEIETKSEEEVKKAPEILEEEVKEEVVEEITEEINETVKEESEEMAESDSKVVDEVIEEVVNEASENEDVVAEFNEGDAPKEMVTEEKSPEIISEEISEADKTEVVQEVEAIEETPAEVKAPEPTMEERIAEVEKKMEAKINELNKAKDERIAVLEEALQQSKIEGQRFQDVAAEAINELAKGTTSVWKPEKAEASESVAGTGGSIFQMALNAAQKNK